MNNNIDHDEEIIFSAKVHWISVVPWFVLAAIVLLVFVRLGALILWIVLVPLLIIGRPLIMLLTTDFILTSKRLIGRSGLISTKSLDSPINKLNLVKVDIGLLGKMFDYGNVVVATSSGSYVFHNIIHPEYIRQSIMGQIEKSEDERIKKQAEETARAMRSND